MEGAPQAQLPIVTLRDRKIPSSVLKLVPLDTAKKYQVVAFEMNDTALKFAIVYPEQLKQGFMAGINDLGKRVGRTVELYKTDSGSLQAALRQYDAPAAPQGSIPVQAPPQAGQGAQPVPQGAQAQQAPVAAPVPVAAPPVAPASMKPPVFQVGKTVAFSCLKRVPLDYAKAHRVACVDFLAPNTYWFATDGSDEAAAQRLLDAIAGGNGISAQRILLKKHELDDLLSYYERLSKEESDRVRAAAPAPAPKPAPQEEPKPEAKAETPASQAAQPAAPAADSDVKQEASVGESQAKPDESVDHLDPSADDRNGVTSVDEQAAIVSNEEEKGGVAGLFQRLSVSLSANSKDKGEEEADSAPVGPVKLVAPETGVSSRSAAMPAQLVQPGPNVPAAAAGTPAPPAAAPAASQGAAVAKTDDENGDIGKLLDHQVSNLDELKEIIKKGFIPRLVAAIVSYAIFEKASDIHIEAFDDEVRIRYRIDGQLLDIVKLPVDVHAALVSRIKILSRLRLDETRVPQDGRFDVNFNDAQVDLRVSLMPTVHGEKVVMRILDKSKGIASLEKLGIEGLAYENLTKAIQKPFGIALATGPTGSGKSTTLYAVLNRIATPNVNVVTLEDPVEYEMKGVNQAQIRPKIGFTFAEGLRSILRQDPNIIMVGEIRDGETANMATQAALTGHLVLSTLHTNDAAGAIPRLTNMGIEPFLIASSLNVAIGQRLVRKICPDCKKEVSLPPGFKAQIEADIETIRSLNPSDAARIPNPLKFYQGMGCSTCGGKGYMGRLGIYEVLVMSEGVEELTLARASNEQIQQQAQKEGMLSMYQDGLLKVVAGVTTLDEVLRETSSR